MVCNQDWLLEKDELQRVVVEFIYSNRLNKDRHSHVCERHLHILTSSHYRPLHTWPELSMLWLFISTQVQNYSLHNSIPPTTPQPLKNWFSHISGSNSYLTTPHITSTSHWYPLQLQHHHYNLYLGTIIYICKSISTLHNSYSFFLMQLIYSLIHSSNLNNNSLTVLINPFKSKLISMSTPNDNSYYNKQLQHHAITITVLLPLQSLSLISMLLKSTVL